MKIVNVGVAVEIASLSLSVQKLSATSVLALAMLSFALLVFAGSDKNGLREMVYPQFGPTGFGIALLPHPEA